MKTLFIKDKTVYNGEQLRPLTNYLRHGLMGNSVVSWVGPCNVTLEHMIDAEDVRGQESIAADEMVHFIIELFDVDLKAGVFLQRLMAEMTIRLLQKLSQNKNTSDLIRKGDDIYLGAKKLNISIATCSANSCLIHFAVNSKPTGAPVNILCLEDLAVSSADFSQEMLKLLQLEIEDSLFAAQKVKTF